MDTATNIATTQEQKTRPSRSKPQDADRHVAMKIRQRRIMLGLTQQQFGEMIGVTYQQAHKYEIGLNRISSGRLYKIAQALGIEIGHLFDGLGNAESARTLPQQRMLLELANSFLKIKERRHQEALCAMARALVEPERPGAG